MCVSYGVLWFTISHEARPNLTRIRSTSGTVERDVQLDAVLGRNARLSKAMLAQVGPTVSLRIGRHTLRQAASSASRDGEHVRCRALARRSPDFFSLSLSTCPPRALAAPERAPDRKCWPRQVAWRSGSGVAVALINEWRRQEERQKRTRRRGGACASPESAAGFTPQLRRFLHTLWAALASPGTNKASTGGVALRNHDIYLTSRSHRRTTEKNEIPDAQDASKFRKI